MNAVYTSHVEFKQVIYVESQDLENWRQRTLKTIAKNTKVFPFFFSSEHFLVVV